MGRRNFVVPNRPLMAFLAISGFQDDSDIFHRVLHQLEQELHRVIWGAGQNPLLQNRLDQFDLQNQL